MSRLPRGRAAGIDEAKAQFLTNWQKCRIELDTARALFYLSWLCQVCVRVPCRRASSRRAYQRPRGSLPLGRMVIEIKHDGIRVIARKEGKRVGSTAGQATTDDRFPLIVEALAGCAPGRA